MEFIDQRKCNLSTKENAIYRPKKVEVIDKKIDLLKEMQSMEQKNLQVIEATNENHL